MIFVFISQLWIIYYKRTVLACRNWKKALCLDLSLVVIVEGCSSAHSIRDSKRVWVKEMNGHLHECEVCNEYYRHDDYKCKHYTKWGRCEKHKVWNRRKILARGWFEQPVCGLWARRDNFVFWLEKLASPPRWLNNKLGVIWCFRLQVLSNNALWTRLPMLLFRTVIGKLVEETKTLRKGWEER